MSVNFDRKTLRSIARKTLGRVANDDQPISPVYIAHLRHFLSSHSDEQDFFIDIDNGDGAVFCRVCDRQLPPGSGEPEEDGKDIFGSLNNFEEHLKSSAHYRRKRLAAQTTQRNVGNTSKSSNAEPGPSRASISSHQVVDLTSSPLRLSINSGSSTPSRFKTTQQDIDEDYLLALKLNEELNGPSAVETGTEEEHPHRLLSSPSRPDIAASPRPSSAYATNPSQDTAMLDREEIEEEFPFFEEAYHAHIQDILSALPGEDTRSYLLYRESRDVIQARCKVCHFSVELPGSGSFEAMINNVAESFAAYEGHLKSPHHKRKRDDTTLQVAQQMSNPVPSFQLARTAAPVASSFGLQLASPPEDRSKGKRRLPGAWYDDQDPDQTYDPYGAHNDSFEFTTASALHAVNARQMQQSGPGMEYAASPSAVPETHSRDIRPVAPLPSTSQSINTAESAVEVARNIAIRRFNEVQAAKLDGYGSHRGFSASDFNINYDEAGPLRKIDMVGPDLDKRFKDFMNKALEEFKDVTTVTDAQKKLNMRTENDLLHGMGVCLLPHQIIGVAWMIDQEKDDEKRGGILADAMGLGKTIQMIATMAYNQPAPRIFENSFFGSDSSDKGKGKEVEHVRRTTLVLAPASLLQQWYEEFDDKTAPGVFRVHIHHGKDKLQTVKEIEDYDVVIASHQSVVMDFPKEKEKKPTDAIDEDDSSDLDISPANRKTLGVLARVRWLRIVIDEAQSIRNRSTRISMCVAKLDSRYRWCLTGTPITNTLADIYGFMRFCRFAPWNDWKLFNDKIGKVQKKYPARAGQKAQAILKPHLLRRTKDSKLDGRPIIRLGPKTIDMIELDFTPEERQMYADVEARQQKIVSRFLREGTVMKNYSIILIMILRLRQLCCHPRLAITEAEKLVMDADSLRAELVKATNLMGERKVKEIKERFKSRILHRMKAELGLHEPENDECSICMEPFVENRRVTSCAHEFCSDCITEVLQKAEGRSMEDAAHCPLCRGLLSRENIFMGKIFEPTPEELEELGRNLPNPTDADSDFERPQKKPKVDSSSDLKDSVMSKEDDAIFNGTVDDNVEPSTKMRQMLETLLEGKAQCPGDKTIIYSQWTSMLDLVQSYLQRHDIDTLRYDGRMNRLARVASVNQFKKLGGPSVMLVSLKCGGVGLNLTVANRVMNLDLAWNYATEAQAYDRVHRLGQQKPVNIHRLIIRDTIEERIVRLQAKKQGLSDAALGEGTGNKLQRMTARDIAQLFDL